MPNLSAAHSDNAGTSARNRLRSNIASLVCEFIRSEGLSPGYHLVESELCRKFGVSRTPIRAALSLLEEDGIVEHRQNRGFAVKRIPPPHVAKDPTEGNEADEEANELFRAIASEHLAKRLPKEGTQQELMRIFDARLPIILKVLQRMASLGLVERKPGNGWKFLLAEDSEQAELESYHFRSVIEPAMFDQPHFNADPTWLRSVRKEHESFAKRKWRDLLAVEFYEMNARFHQGIADSSHNRYLQQAMEQQNALRRFLNYRWGYGEQRVHESIAEHLAMISAIEEGDLTRARDLMRQHLWIASEAPLGLQA